MCPKLISTSKQIPFSVVRKCKSEADSLPEPGGDFVIRCGGTVFSFSGSSEVEMQFIECQAGDSVIIDNRTEIQVLSVKGDEVTVAIIRPDEDYREETLVLCTEHELAGTASS